MFESIARRDGATISLSTSVIVEAFDVHVPGLHLFRDGILGLSRELLNLRLRKKSSPVDLHDRYAPDSGKQN